MQGHYSALVRPRKPIVEAYFEGLRRRDHQQVLDLLTDDVVWELPGFRKMAGKEQFAGEIENDAVVGRPNLVVDKVFEDGETAVVLGSGSAEQPSGDAHRFAFCDIITFDGDLIARVESYLVPLG